MSLRRKFIIAVLVFALLGILDAGYLTMEHYSNAIPPCSTSIWVDCGRVLKSKYAMVGQIPLSLLGLAYYSTMVGFGLVRFAVDKQMTFKEILWKILERYARPRAWTLEKMLFYTQLALSGTGALFSVYFVYLQVGVIHAICLYCMTSAVLSFLMFGIMVGEYFKVQKQSL